MIFWLLVIVLSKFTNIPKKLYKSHLCIKKRTGLHGPSALYGKECQLLSLGDKVCRAAYLILTVVRVSLTYESDDVTLLKSEVGK